MNIIIFVNDTGHERTLTEIMRLITNLIRTGVVTEVTGKTGFAG